MADVEVEIPVKLRDGTVERWGLGYDDHCVVVLKKQEITDMHGAVAGVEWQPQSLAYIPYEVAKHISALALSREVYSQALRAAADWTHNVGEGAHVGWGEVYRPAARESEAEVKARMQDEAGMPENAGVVHGGPSLEQPLRWHITIERDRSPGHQGMLQVTHSNPVEGVKTVRG